MFSGKAAPAAVVGWSPSAPSSAASAAPPDSDATSTASSGTSATKSTSLASDHNNSPPPQLRRSESTTSGKAMVALESMISRQQQEQPRGTLMPQPAKRLPTGLPQTLELSGGILILARVRPSEEEDFAQILLPVALSYETFLCKLCVALGVEKESVKKILKLPDILIRSTEDVVRLENWDKLEIRLKRPSPIRSLGSRCAAVTRTIGPTLLITLLMAYTAVLLRGQHQIQSDLTQMQAAVEKQISNALTAGQVTGNIHQAITQLLEEIRNNCSFLHEHVAAGSERCSSSVNNVRTKWMQSSDVIPTTKTDSILQATYGIARHESTADDDDSWTVADQIETIEKALISLHTRAKENRNLLQDIRIKGVQCTKARG